MTSGELMVPSLSLFLFLSKQNRKFFLFPGDSKLANLLFAKEFNERYREDGITAYSVHPGGIHTNLQGHVGFVIYSFLSVNNTFSFFYLLKNLFVSHTVGELHFFGRL